MPVMQGAGVLARDAAGQQVAQASWKSYCDR
jgi:hypothetical protein